MAGIKNLRVTGNEWVVRKSLICRCIQHDHYLLCMQYGVRAEIKLACGLGKRKSGSGLEPLAVSVDERDKRNGGITSLRGKPRDVIERLIW